MSVRVIQAFMTELYRELVLITGALTLAYLARS